LAPFYGEIHSTARYAEFNRTQRTAITGSLAQLLLDEGQAWVSLFADAANPVSNGIYQRLGFKPELNYRTWLFG